MTPEHVKELILPACHEFEVKRLDVFGSTARRSATSGSDLDLLVEFSDPERNAGRRFFGLLHRLEDLFNCNIDLLTLDSLRNPYLRDRVLNERIPIYEG